MELGRAARCWLLIALLCGSGQPGGGAGLVGLRLEGHVESVSMHDRYLEAQRGSVFTLRLFGSDLLGNSSSPRVAFAGEQNVAGVDEDPCTLESARNSSVFRVRQEFRAQDEHSGVMEVFVVEEEAEGGLLYRICVLNGETWGSLGEDRLRLVEPRSEGVPMWALAVIIAVLALFCALLRVLQLSLLWLDPLELYVLHSCGAEDERRTAKRLEPLRRRGNLLVCALLVPCALLHSALGVLLYHALGSVLPAVLACGALLFLVTELLPHVLSSGHGFRVAPGLVWLGQACLVFTCPLSCPLGLILDVALRRDVSTCGVREKVMEMVRSNVNDPYGEFVKEEFRRGALRSKTVEDILTPLKDCFMLPSTAVLDFSTMSEIMQSGYTRVPVYEEERSNIVEILYVKDLALVDPEDRTPMTTITKFYNHPLHFVFNDTKLDAMLEEFKKGVIVIFVFLTKFDAPSLA